MQVYTATINPDTTCTTDDRLEDPQAASRAGLPTPHTLQRKKWQ